MPGFDGEWSGHTNAPNAEVARELALRGDAGALLACQEILKTQGLSPATLAQCEPLTLAMPTATLRLEFTAYLTYELQSATQPHSGRHSGVLGWLRGLVATTLHAGSCVVAEPGGVVDRGLRLLLPQAWLLEESLRVH